MVNVPTDILQEVQSYFLELDGNSAKQILFYCYTVSGRKTKKLRRWMVLAQ